MSKLLFRRLPVSLGLEELVAFITEKGFEAKDYNMISFYAGKVR